MWAGKRPSWGSFSRTGGMQDLARLDEVGIGTDLDPIRHVPPGPRDRDLIVGSWSADASGGDHPEAVSWADNDGFVRGGWLPIVISCGRWCRTARRTRYRLGGAGPAGCRNGRLRAPGSRGGPGGRGQRTWQRRARSPGWAGRRRNGRRQRGSWSDEDPNAQGAGDGATQDGWHGGAGEASSDHASRAGQCSGEHGEECQAEPNADYPQRRRGQGAHYCVGARPFYPRSGVAQTGGNGAPVRIQHADRDDVRENHNAHPCRKLHLRSITLRLLMFAFIQMGSHAVKADHGSWGRARFGDTGENADRSVRSVSWGDERGRLRLSEADSAMGTNRRSRPSGA